MIFTSLAATLLASTTLTASLAAPDAITSPLRLDVEQVRSGNSAAAPLSFDAAAYAQLAGRDRVRLEQFPLAPMGRGQVPDEATLDLFRINTVNERSQFVVASVVDGQVVERPITRPDVEMFRGSVLGDDESFVFIAFSPHGTHGYIRTQNVTQLISPGPFGGNRTPLIYNLDAVPAGSIRWRDFVCNTDLHPPLDGGQPWSESSVQTGEPPCRRVEVAIETDVQFTEDLFGSDTEAAGAYVATLIGASSEIFERDVNVEFDIVFVRLWEGSDPWDENGTSSQLFQFRDYWNDNMNHINRHLAHYLSGRALGGGVAWLNAICHASNGYALSANLNGFFPYPMQDNHEQNWDIMVVSHEFGHNFGTPHTHNFCPPLDECWSGDCSSGNGCISNGTIMGYCHTCPGGMTNVVLEFHPQVIETILNYLNTVTNCYIGCVPQSDIVYVPQDTPSIQEALLVVLPGGEVVVSPGVYAEAINPGGKAVHLRSTDGPEATIIDAAGLNASVARFSSGEGSETILDGFTLTGGTGSPVSLGGTNYVLGGGIYLADSSPTITNCIIIGNSAQFGGGMFNNGASPSVENSIIAENTSATSSGGGVFNFVGASPQFVNVTFRDNTAAANGGAMSSQNASPSVTNCMFIENSASGSGGAVRNIQGSTGQFIDCTFQANTAGDTGGAMINDESGGTSIAGSHFCENTPNDITGSYTNAGGNTFDPLCFEPGDLNGDGVVDVSDLLILLGAWGECSPGPCEADLNGDGNVDVSDLLLLLSNWG